MQPATSTAVHQVEDVLFFTLIQLIVIIVAARVANVAARKAGQPGAVGEIIAGLLLGPSLLGHFAPEVSKFLFGSVSAMPITIISQIGLILLMFQIGAEFDFAHLRHSRNRLATMSISLATILTPFCLGLGIGWLSAPILAPAIDPICYSLFVAVALSITAVPILGRIMREFGLTRTDIGAITISAAAANDVVGWLLLAFVSSYSMMRFSLTGTLVQVGLVVAFVLFCWYVVRPVLNIVLARFNISEESVPPGLMVVVLALVFALAICTYKLGIFAIFGGFIAGTLLHRHEHFVVAWRNQVGGFVLVFFLPVFFTYTGLRTNITGLDSLELWGWCGLLIAAAVLGKMLPSYVVGRMTGLSSAQASVIGVLMNTRALMELVVLNIGYDLGFIPQNVFTMLVMMAVLTTVMTAPLLRLVLPRTGHRIPVGVEA